jgi:hypothetical protein
MKKEYMKPTVKVVQLQHRTTILSGSPVGLTSTNLDPEDEIDISSEPGSVWGR